MVLLSNFFFPRMRVCRGDAVMREITSRAQGRCSLMLPFLILDAWFVSSSDCVFHLAVMSLSDVLF